MQPAKKLSLFMAAACSLTAFSSHASESAHLMQQHWAFDGVFGKFDKPSIQRGFQVYKEVCSACHGLKRVPFRRMQDIGFSEAEVKSLAASYQIKDGPNDSGEMFERAGRPSDRFPSPFANDNAARAAHGAVPPDLSLIIKARPDGANYVYSLLHGYEPAPEGVEVPAGAHYNKYFPGGIIKMAQPLKDEQVTYQDAEVKATLDQQSKDIVNFLQWAAEPEMEDRKRMGLKVMIFLGVMTALFYAVKKRIWNKIGH